MKLIMLLIAALGVGPSVGAAELKGVVKAEDGKLLAGVRILTYAPAGPAKILGMQVASSSKRYEVTTDASGSFTIPSHGQLVYFNRADLRPVTKIVDLAITHIQVTMEEGSRTLWKIPACSSTDKASRTGIGFMFSVPDKVMIKKDTERFEGEGYFFGYRAGEKVDIFINSWESTSLEPDERWLLESREFSQRMWSSGEKWGYEFRGTLPDGKTWRRISIKNGAITYRFPSKEAMNVFDSMIDAVCFDESAVKW